MDVTIKVWQDERGGKETGIAPDCTTKNRQQKFSRAIYPSIPTQTESKPKKSNNDPLSSAKTRDRGKPPLLVSYLLNPLIVI